MDLGISRARELSDIWIEKIGKSLKEDVSVLARKNFNVYVQEGGRLTYD